jgi:hypothetical protein
MQPLTEGPVTLNFLVSRVSQAQPRERRRELPEPTGNWRSFPLTSHSEMEAATQAPTATKPDRAAMPTAVVAHAFNLVAGFPLFTCRTTSSPGQLAHLASSALWPAQRPGQLSALGELQLRQLGARLR